MPKSNDEQMIDLLRSIMYGGSDGKDNLLPDVILLSQMLAKRDGVAFDPTKNKLVQCICELKRAASIWDEIIHLND